MKYIFLNYYININYQLTTFNTQFGENCLVVGKISLIRKSWH